MFVLSQPQARITRHETHDDVDNSRSLFSDVCCAIDRRGFLGLWAAERRAIGLQANTHAGSRRSVVLGFDSAVVRQRIDVLGIPDGTVRARERACHTLPLIRGGRRAEMCDGNGWVTVWRKITSRRPHCGSATFYPWMGRQYGSHYTTIHSENTRCAYSFIRQIAIAARSMLRRYGR